MGPDETEGRASGTPAGAGAARTSAGPAARMAPGQRRLLLVMLGVASAISAGLALLRIVS